MVKSWYKEMAVYQVWPRSFCDGNGDGIGDLKGVLSKLDYIKSLGVDAIWFSPLYKSPQKDYGYDIADYRSIQPEYGTMEEFKQVLDEAHKRGLRVIMDLVINHTSDKHEWFLESLKGDDNPYHDYYFWRKGKGKRRPNNWMSTFAGPAWEYNEKLDEYYLHLFAVEWICAEDTDETHASQYLPYVVIFGMIMEIGEIFSQAVVDCRYIILRPYQRIAQLGGSIGFEGFQFFVVHDVKYF